jgi:ABC-type transporter Mla MlaB component
VEIDVIPSPHELEYRSGGGLISAATPDLRRWGRTAAERRRSLHLDLTRVTKMEPPGLGCLLGVIRGVREAGGSVSITAEHTWTG